jgi:restriction system protein
MDWRVFEELCAEYFSFGGWNTKLSPLGADGGIDIYIQKRKKKGIVQCKRYHHTLVRVTAVREIFGVMSASEADIGYFITSSRFTKECYSFAKDKNIILIDGGKFISLLR